MFDKFSYFVPETVPMSSVIWKRYMFKSYTLVYKHVTEAPSRSQQKNSID